MTTENQEKLTDRQREILDLLSTFRYLTRPQIQTILNHKHKVRIIEWLDDLTERNYIYRFYSKEFAGTPSEYCLDSASIPYFKEKNRDERILKRIYTEKKNSQIFRKHNIFIASIYLSLVDLMSITKGRVDFYSRSQLYNIKYLIIPHPDCYFAITEKSGTVKRYFLDAFENDSFLYKRVYQYLHYFKKKHWQNHTDKSFPEIILICPDVRIKRKLYTFIQKKLEETSPSFYLSTKEEIETKGIRKETLQKVMIEDSL